MTAHARTLLPAVFVLLAVLPSVVLQAGVGQWTSSGPEGGFVETLAVHPSHPSIVYAATFRHLYKSVDAGASWVPTGLPGGTNLVLPTSDPTVAYATAQPGGSFWVFHTGLTDLEYTLTVTDQVAGVVRTYAGGATNGTRLCGAADTAAFRN